ncbi:MAG: hypothetical protein IPN33_14635 [Saprospiraceae bacterium]|nr:hypothetical protein [Saprospiraceae bacterium]
MWPPTNSSHPNPIIQFYLPGTYTVRLRVFGCGDPEWMTTITVVAPAAINIDAIPDQCGDAASVLISPTAGIGGDTPTVSWLFPGGNPTAFTGNSPPISHIHPRWLPISSPSRQPIFAAP